MKWCFGELICFVLTATMIFSVCPFVYASAEETVYADVSQGYWAYNDINYCMQQEWIIGYPDGSFMPEGAVTRAETVKTLAAFLKREIKKGRYGLLVYSVCKCSKGYTAR